MYVGDCDSTGGAGPSFLKGEENFGQKLVLLLCDDWGFFRHNLGTVNNSRNCF